MPQSGWPYPVFQLIRVPSVRILRPLRELGQELEHDRAWSLAA